MVPSQSPENYSTAVRSSLLLEAVAAGAQCWPGCSRYADKGCTCLLDNCTQGCATPISQRHKHSLNSYNFFCREKHQSHMGTKRFYAQSFKSGFKGEKFLDSAGYFLGGWVFRNRTTPFPSLSGSLARGPDTLPAVPPYRCRGSKCRFPLRWGSCSAAQ